MAEQKKMRGITVEVVTVISVYLWWLFGVFNKL